MSVMVQHLAKSWYGLSHQAQTAIYLHKPADRGFQEKFTEGVEGSNEKTGDWIIDLKTKDGVKYAITNFSSEIINVQSSLSMMKQGKSTTMVDFKQPRKKKKNNIIRPTCKEQQLKCNNTMFFIYKVKTWMA